MVRRRRLNGSGWGLVLLLLLALACGRAAQKTALPQPPGGAIQPDATASKRVQQNYRQALQESSAQRPFRLLITNEEVTSLVALALKERPDIPFTNPQIWFAGGKIYITGQVTGLAPAALPALIVAAPVVSEGEPLRLAIERAQMGGFDFPDSLIESLTETVNESLADLQRDVEITAVEVREGAVLLTGRRVDP